MKSRILNLKPCQIHLPLSHIPLIVENANIIPRHMIVAGYYGIMLAVCVSLCLFRPSVVHLSGFSFLEDNLIK